MSTTTLASGIESSLDPLTYRGRDISHLAPDDALQSTLQSRRERRSSPLSLDGVATLTTSSLRTQDAVRSRPRKDKPSTGRRKKGAWKKLLWVKQSYPDNYTDEYTFLDHLQRNPRLQPYEFWRLVADSTVIVQHVASVIIFVCCFCGIFQERVSPITVVGWASFVTVLGWVLWDFWMGLQEEEESVGKADNDGGATGLDGVEEFPAQSGNEIGKEQEKSLAQEGLDRVAGTASTMPAISSGISTGKNVASNTLSPDLVGHPTGASTFAIPPYGINSSSLSPRNQQRLATMKSAILIYFAVLGLSPILKSLTKSTSSDSIWAMSSWLMGINIFFFDYGGGVGVKFPATLSTNAALMASTVLASRLTSTTHVFSLTLFSIEVFGLFPVFRRHLRHVAWQAHALLTMLLVVGAGGGLSVVISGGAWKAAIIGGLLGSILTTLAMGICSWWLIDLQKYKNEIHGPWDPARPIIRRRWD